jgi:hypothetical protein
MTGKPEAPKDHNGLSLARSGKRQGGLLLSRHDPLSSVEQGKEEAMYKKILVPLDGSSLAERVLPHAQAFEERDD